MWKRTAHLRNNMNRPTSIMGGDWKSDNGKQGVCVWGGGWRDGGCCLKQLLLSGVWNRQDLAACVTVLQLASCRVLRLASGSWNTLKKYGFLSGQATAMTWTYTPWMYISWSYTMDVHAMDARAMAVSLHTMEVHSIYRCTVHSVDARAMDVHTIWVFTLWMYTPCHGCIHYMGVHYGCTPILRRRRRRGRRRRQFLWCPRLRLRRSLHALTIAC